MADNTKVDESGVSSESQATSRMNLSAVGYTGLREVSGYIFEESKTALRWPYAGQTYQQMMLDPTIASVTNFIKMMLLKAEWYPTYPEGSSQQVVEASEFLSYAMSNMEDMTWRDFIGQCVDHIFKGFAINEKVFTRVSEGKWEGKIKWKHLPSRPQETLTGWEIANDGLVRGVNQNPSRIGISSPAGEVYIPRKKFLHFRNMPVGSNPEGTAALKGCYIPWREKTLAQELELTGMTKDMAGVVDIGVDAEYLSKAALNPGGPEDRNIQQMKKDAANLSSGEQSYIISPIAYNENGKELFHFKLTGIDGGGKQYSSDDIIKRKQNEIFSVFLADILKMGQDATGSYALSDTKNNILGIALEGYLRSIQDVINRDLIPQTLALNGWRFSAEEMPKVQFGDVEERNLDDLSKFIQRTVSVGAISTDTKLDNALRESARLPEADYDNPLQPQDNESRAGDGMQTAGEGTSENVSDDASVGNNENS